MPDADSDSRAALDVARQYGIADVQRYQQGSDICDHLGAMLSKYVNSKADTVISVALFLADIKPFAKRRWGRKGCGRVG
jgi:hypothetical protein